MAKVKKEKTPAQKTAWYKRDLKMLWGKSFNKWQAYARAKLKPAYVKCEECQKETYWKLAEIDHINPIVPVEPDELDKLYPDEEWAIAKYAFRLNCPASKLQVLCEVCHAAKSKGENKKRVK